MGASVTVGGIGMGALPICDCATHVELNCRAALRMGARRIICGARLLSFRVSGQLKILRTVTVDPKSDTDQTHSRSF